MQVEIEALVVRFKGEILSVDPLSDMYSWVNISFEPGTPEFEHMQENFNSFQGDMYVMSKYILPNLEIGNAKKFSLNGEAKDVGFTIGEVQVGIERMTVEWKKD